MELTGQVAVVTGGGRGLGRGFALALAGAGAAVAVVARSEDELRATVAAIERAGGRAVAVAVDVTDRPAIEAMVAEVTRQLGPIDLLVNNAGVYRAPGAVWTADPDDWWRELEINLRGPHLCSRAVLPGMVARRRGRIVNVASDAGIVPGPNASAYGTSKAALIRFSEVAALEAKAYGISVFSIHPGTVRTAMVESILASETMRERAPAVQSMFRELAAEQRLVPPERATELVLTLASGRADALTGRYLTVRDDVEELVARAEEIERGDLLTLRLRV